MIYIIITIGTVVVGSVFLLKMTPFLFQLEIVLMIVGVQHTTNYMTLCRM